MVLFPERRAEKNRIFPQYIDEAMKNGKEEVFGSTGYDLNDYRWYLNRELTWLEFNKRVLHEAVDERNPLLERIFFFAVVGSNLDEFFMKRIGGLKQQVGAGMKKLSVDGMLPEEQIEACGGQRP